MLRPAGGAAACSSSSPPHPHHHLLQTFFIISRTCALAFRTHRLPRCLRGLDVSRLQHHLDLVLGAREELDGPALAEPGPVHLEEDRAVVGLDPQRDGDVDDRGDVVHGAELREGEADG